MKEGGNVGEGVGEERCYGREGLNITWKGRERGGRREHKHTYL